MGLVTEVLWQQLSLQCLVSAVSNCRISACVLLVQFNQLPESYILCLASIGLLSWVILQSSKTPTCSLVSNATKKNDEVCSRGGKHLPDFLSYQTGRNMRPLGKSKHVLRLKEGKVDFILSVVFCFMQGNVTATLYTFCSSLLTFKYRGSGRTTPCFFSGELRTECHWCHVMGNSNKIILKLCLR